MDRSWQPVTLAIAGSGALLGGALTFQYLGGLAPCEMCIWQRWPHGLAIVIGVLALFLRAARQVLSGLAAVIVLIGAGIGLFHAGIEYGWWDGVTACTSPIDTTQSTEDLLATILEAPLVRCDEVAWSLMGLSMAGWNAIFSIALACIWTRAYASSSASQ